MRGDDIEVGEDEILYGEYLDHVATKKHEKPHPYHEIFG